MKKNDKYFKDWDYFLISNKSITIEIITQYGWGCERHIFLTVLFPGYLSKHYKNQKTK